MTATRCGWATHELLISYHDQEWGIPVHEDRRLFELLILEGAQAGLSWLTVLKKRDAYRRAFERFDPEKIARFDEKKLQALLRDTGLIRNRLKMTSAIHNARAVLEIQREFGRFDRYIWQFVGGTPIINSWKSGQSLPCRSPESDTMSRDFRRRGFTFVGTKICYSFMQATGMVNDHTTDCFRYRTMGTR